METPRLIPVLSIVNLGILLVLLLTQIRSVEASGVVPMLAGAPP